MMYRYVLSNKAPQKNQQLQQLSLEITKLVIISYNISYFHMQQSFMVRPLEANLLHQPEWTLKMDPFCRIFLGKQSQQTAVSSKGGKNPKWGDNFIFSNTGDLDLKIEVWDSNKQNHSQLVGSGSLNLSKIMIQGGGTSAWVDLGYKGRNAGKICLAIQSAGQHASSQGVGLGTGFGVGQGVTFGTGVGEGISQGQGMAQIQGKSHNLQGTPFSQQGIYQGQSKGPFYQGQSYQGMPQSQNKVYQEGILQGQGVQQGFSLGQVKGQNISPQIQVIRQGEGKSQVIYQTQSKNMPYDQGISSTSSQGFSQTQSKGYTQNMPNLPQQQQIPQQQQFHPQTQQQQPQKQQFQQLPQHQQFQQLPQHQQFQQLPQHQQFQQLPQHQQSQQLPQHQQFQQLPQHQQSQQLPQHQQFQQQFPPQSQQFPQQSLQQPQQFPQQSQQYQHYQQGISQAQGKPYTQLIVQEGKGQVQGQSQGQGVPYTQVIIKEQPKGQGQKPGTSQGQGIQSQGTGRSGSPRH